MTASRDPDGLIHAFINEGEEELHDQVYDAVRAAIEHKRQRAAVGPWRAPTMNKFVTIGLGAAAVVVLLLVGSTLLGSGSTPPGGAPSASVAPSPEATATPEPYAAVGETFPGAGPLEPGTRYTASVGGSAPITFAVPAPGWRSDPPGWVFHGDAVAGPPGDALVWFNTESAAPAIYTDACAHTGMEEFEASAAGRVEAMTALDGAEVVSGPSPVTIDGRTGQFVAFVIPEDVGCDNSEYWIGANEDGSISWYPAYLGGTNLSWAVDLDDGQYYVLDVQTRPGVSAEVLEEIEQIVQSIQFE